MTPPDVSVVVPLYRTADAVPELGRAARRGARGRRVDVRAAPRRRCLPGRLGRGRRDARRRRSGASRSSSLRQNVGQHAAVLAGLAAAREGLDRGHGRRPAGPAGGSPDHAREPAARPACPSSLRVAAAGTSRAHGCSPRGCTSGRSRCWPASRRTQGCSVALERTVVAQLLAMDAPTPALARRHDRLHRGRRCAPFRSSESPRAGGRSSYSPVGAAAPGVASRGLGRVVEGRTPLCPDAPRRESAGG